MNQLALNQFTATGGFYPLARIRWLEGKIDEVETIYNQMCVPTDSPEMPHAPVLRLLVRGFLQCARQDFAGAEKSFQQAIKLDDEIHLASIFASPRFFLAYLYWRWQRPSLALNELEKVLTFCQLENTPGFILQEGALAIPLLQLAVKHNLMQDYAEKLFSLMDTAVSPSAPPQTQPVPTTLTSRELEVLQLLASGASNKVISETLTISLPTVKSHVSHILKKLDCASRGAAVAKAREYGLA